MICIYPTIYRYLDYSLLTVLGPKNCTLVRLYSKILMKEIHFNLCKEGRWFVFVFFCCCCNKLCEKHFLHLHVSHSLILCMSHVNNLKTQTSGKSFPGLSLKNKSNLIFLVNIRLLVSQLLRLIKCRRSPGG